MSPFFGYLPEQCILNVFYTVLKHNTAIAQSLTTVSLIEHTLHKTGLSNGIAMQWEIKQWYWVVSVYQSKLAAMHLKHENMLCD